MVNAMDQIYLKQVPVYACACPSQHVSICSPAPDQGCQETGIKEIYGKKKSVDTRAPKTPLVLGYSASGLEE